MLRKIDERTFASGLLAAAVVSGLLIPSLSKLLAPFALTALLAVVVLSFLPFARLPTEDLFSISRPVLRIVAWQQFVLPAIVVSLAIVAKLPEHTLLLIVVTATSGAIFASPAIAEMLHLDRNRALQSMVFSTLLTPISLLLFMSLFRDAYDHISLTAYIERMALFLGVPAIVFLVYRSIVGRMSERAAQAVNTGARWATVGALMVFCIGIMHAVSAELLINPRLVVVDLIVATSLCAGMLGVTVVVMYRFGARHALTAGVVTGFRNVGLGYALIGDAISPDIAIYVGVSMLPMFIAPFIIRLHHITRSTANARHSIDAVAA